MGLFTKSRKDRNSASAMEQGAGGHAIPLSEKPKKDETRSQKQSEKEREKDKEEKHDENRAGADEKRAKRDEEKQEKKLGKQKDTASNNQLTDTARQDKELAKREEASRSKSRMSKKGAPQSSKEHQSEAMVDETEPQGPGEEEPSSKPDTKEKKLLEKIDSVKTIMDDNLQKSLQRGEKMEEIGAQADELQKQSRVFKTDVVKAKKRITWLHWRSYIICGAITVSLISVALILLILAK